MKNQDAIIENKLLAKEEFQKLDKLLNRFNIFEATDMRKQEIKHTKFLSYLLDPNESHGLGEVFIKNLVTRISEKYENFPPILDLDFSFAEVKAEFHFTEQGILDSLIKIPFRNTCRQADQKVSEVIIGLENKINSKQNIVSKKNADTNEIEIKKQLSKYTGGLKEKFPDHDECKFIFKFYLIYNEEDPAEEDWKVITYRNFVLPAIKSTIDILDKRVSDYLKACLISYQDLLIDDSDGENEEDQLANQLLQDQDIENFIKEKGTNKSKIRDTFGSIYVKHKKVIEYLSEFDNDKRSEILKHWKKYDSNQEHKLETDKSKQSLKLKFESSNRSYLRFSVLTDFNREQLSRLHNDESLKQFDSDCPLAFDIRFDLVDKKTFKVRTTLTLGPIEPPEEREKLLKAIYPSLKGKKFVDKDYSPFYTTLINAKKERFIVECDSISNPKKWIEANILSFDKGPIKVEEWIINVSVKLNAALDDYFKNSIAKISE